MDFARAFSEVLSRVVIYHVFPAVILSGTTLLFVSAIIRIGRIKRPFLRGTLFFIALVKPLFVLIQGTYLAPNIVHAAVAPSLQLPDPINLVPAHLWHNDAQLLDTNMSISLILILALVSLFLFLRWRSYYSFSQELSQGTSLGQKEEQELQAVLPELEEKIGTEARLLVTETEYDSPFSVGVTDPVMVFPSYILKQLTTNERQAVLVHELVHVQRRDTLKQWMTVILKDLLSFSPFTHFTFAEIDIEREKRVDWKAATYTNDSLSLSSALLKTAKLIVGRKKAPPMTQSFLAQKFLPRRKALTQRIETLIDFSQSKKPDTLSWRQRILIGIAIVLLLYPQVFLHIRALSYMIQIF